MSDEEKVAFEQRIARCEAQLGLVRKRMLSMGILILLLFIALIWRTKPLGDLLRPGDAARFSSVEVVDDMGGRAVLRPRALTLHSLDEEGKTVLAAANDSDRALTIQRPGGGLWLSAAQFEMGHADGSIKMDHGMLRFERFTMIRPDTAGLEGETTIGPGFVSVRDLGGDGVLDGRKEGFGLRLRDAAGKSEHVKPR